MNVLPQEHTDLLSAVVTISVNFILLICVVQSLILLCGATCVRFSVHCCLCVYIRVSLCMPYAHVLVFLPSLHFPPMRFPLRCLPPFLHSPPSTCRWNRSLVRVCVCICVCLYVLDIFFTASKNFLQVTLNSYTVPEKYPHTIINK